MKPADHLNEIVENLGAVQHRLDNTPDIEFALEDYLKDLEKAAKRLDHALEAQMKFVESGK